MADLRQRLAEALSLAATTRGYRLRDERFHLADGVLLAVRSELAAELRRLADELESTAGPATIGVRGGDDVSAQNSTDVSLSGADTSAECPQAATEALGGKRGTFPAMWWSPSGEQWFADVPGEGLMAFGSLGSREDSLPKDAQRLVPAGPLLTLLPELDQLATEAGRCSEEAEVWVRSCTDRLCARLDSLLPESHAQERTR